MLFMPTPILLATRNKGKAREFQEMLGAEWQVLTSSDVPDLPDVSEDGETFEANAQKKALACGAIFSGFVLADDSGLEVDALNGVPGIHSARFAGEPSNDLRNNELLLTRMLDVPEDSRGAQFVCVLALTKGATVLGLYKGILRGRVLYSARGQGGFGYDPAFVPEGYQESFGELDYRIKNSISHRAQALQALISDLDQLKKNRPQFF